MQSAANAFILRQFMNENAMKSSDSTAERLLTKQQVAGALATSSRTVERLASSGQLARVKILGAVRYRWSDVLRLMNGGQPT
jgi:hypothetical protein